MGLLLVSFAAPGAQEKKGVCFTPEDKEKEVCIDFASSWFYVEQRHGDLFVIYVRQVNTRAENHIWNNGQYLISAEEFKKVEAGLSGLGFGLSCPPPDIRRLEDYLKSREEICKK